MDLQTVLYSGGDGVARIVLNRPDKRNALEGRQAEPTAPSLSRLPRLNAMHEQRVHAPCRHRPTPMISSEVSRPPCCAAGRRSAHDAPKV